MVFLIYSLPEDSAILGYNAVSMDNLTHVASYLRRKKSSVKNLQKFRTCILLSSPCLVKFSIQEHSSSLLPTSCRCSSTVLFKTFLLVVSDWLVQHTVKHGMSCMQVSDWVICGCKQRNFAIIKIFSQNPTRILRVLQNILWKMQCNARSVCGMYCDVRHVTRLEYETCYKAVSSEGTNPQSDSDNYSYRSSIYWTILPKIL